MRRVTRLFLLSTGLFVIVGLTRYFQGVWQQAPSTANPFDTTWLIVILIALVTGTIILGMFSLFTPAAFRVISRMLGVPEDVKPEVSVKTSSPSPNGNTPVPRATPSATAGVSFEKEKVGIFWDYARSWLFAILGFLLSAFLAFIFNVDKLPSSYQVPSILAALGVVFLSLLGLSWRFQVTAKRVGTLIGRVEKGEPLGDLADLLDIRAFSLKAILRPLFRSTPLVEELSLESVTLQSAVALNDYTAVLHLRNTGSREARINAYSVDSSEWVYVSPSKVIAPSSDAILPVTRDLSHNIRLERGRDHKITLWTEKGWTFTFSFRLQLSGG